MKNMFARFSAIQSFNDTSYACVCYLYEFNTECSRPKGPPGYKMRKIHMNIPWSFEQFH